MSSRAETDREGQGERTRSGEVARVACSPLDRGALKAMLADVVREFFDAYGVACAEQSAEAWPDPDCAELGSIAGIRGKTICGGLAFVAPLALVERLHPALGTRQGVWVEPALRDWCSEMVNQLLGRLKNKLAAHGVDFEVGIPACFSGRSIRLVFLPDADGISASFVAASFPVRVHLECSVQPGVRLTGDAYPAPCARIAAEGDVLLF